MVQPVIPPIGDMISSAIERAKSDAPQKPSASFDEILQQKKSQKEPAPPPPQSKGVSPLDEIREQLTARIAGLKAGDPDGLALPYLSDPGARQSLLSALFNGLDRHSFATDLQALLANLESQWTQLSAISQSGEKLSQSELLTLQSQVYDLSEEIAVLSKLVDEITGGVKTVLRTTG